MPKKCCVTNCDGNFNKGNRVAVFRLPSDNDERERWMKIIPRDNIPDSPETVICERHFPPGYPTIKKFGKKRPRDPPSVFSCVQPSQIPTAPIPPRTTIKASSSVRSIMPDEWEAFLSADKIENFAILQEKLRNNKVNINDFNVIWFVIGDELLVIQSKEFKGNTGIPRFLLKIKENLAFEGFFCGVKYTIVSLSKNRIIFLNTISKVEEALRYLNSLTNSTKIDTLYEHIHAMSPISKIGDKKYNIETIVRAFEYFTISRTLYSRLRNHYELPSISLLTRLTSKLDNAFNDEEFLNAFFSKVSEKQKHCILLIDEVYVKPSLTYHAGSVFGKAVNKPDALATTILSFMLLTLHGGPKYLCRILPVAELTAGFLFQQTNYLLDGITRSGGTTIAIICDNNRVNQAFFKKFDCCKPWQARSGVFLIFDFVHILKSVRNNWITEKCKKLTFLDDGQMKEALWSDIEALYKHEQEYTGILKLSKLTNIAVYPKPIERQKVSTCLQVFSENTVSALRTSTSTESADGTITFLEIFVKFWKVVNVRVPYLDKRLRDPLISQIESPDDDRLLFLIKLADMAKQMTASQGNRQAQLTRDTGNALYHTCHGLVALTKYLLSMPSFDYVLLGMFTSDPLEKMFGKLREGSGGTYFINVQQVLEKVRIQRSKLSLQIGIDMDSLPAEAGHNCEKCGYILDDDASNVFENLPELEKCLPRDVKETVVYISGYISRKDIDEIEATKSYYLEFGNYTEDLNRGGLKIPSDNVCQWVLFSYIIFSNVVDKVCRKSLCNILMVISEFYSFNMNRHHGEILSNIFFKNHVKLYTPRSSKEPKQKILKLSR